MPPTKQGQSAFAPSFDFHSSTATSFLDATPDTYIPLQDLSHTPPTQHLFRRNKNVMKFSHQLLYNSVPEWSSGYINYDSLKASIYSIERDKVRSRAYDDDYTRHSNDYATSLESANLLSPESHVSESEVTFRKLLDNELHKVHKFTDQKYPECKHELDMLLREIEHFENTNFDDDGPSFPRYSIDERPEDDDDDDYDDDSEDEVPPSKPRSRSQTATSANFPSTSQQFPRQSPGRPRRSASIDVQGRPPSSLFGTEVWQNRQIDILVSFKMRLQHLYREFSQLRQFASLNHTGFRKIIKKFDKVNESSLLDPYMNEVVNVSPPFRQQDDEKNAQNLETIVKTYARIVTPSNDTNEAKRQLQTILREHLVWERNTVWREMIGLTSKGWKGKDPDPVTLADRPVVKSVPSPSQSPTSAAERKPIKLSLSPISNRTCNIPPWFVENILNRQVIGLILGVLAFTISMNVTWFHRVEERNCLAILTLCTVFWALEVIPLFATSILAPFLIVTLRVIRSPDDDSRASSIEAASYIFSQMFTPTIMLLVGGFTLAAGLSKHSIDRILSSRVLTLAGTHPPRVLFAYMVVACFASMWISNVAAPVLCFSLIKPILRTLPSRSNFSKALIIGIALSSNIGGLTSPISSPQNLIALEYMHPQISWLSWFGVSIPVAAFIVLLIWTILLHLYKWDKNTIINPTRRPKEKFTSTQWFVSIVSVVTIILWCIEHQIEGVMGDMGVIALIPMVLFFAFGILRKADWESYPWSIVMLAMGGIGLGKAVMSSGLLGYLDTILRHRVEGLSLWPLAFIFSACTVFVATFISHTVAAVLIIPIAAQVGEALDDPRPRLLIMIVTFISSCAMGLPVSSFPNQAAVSLEDDLGVPYLAASDFLKVGILASLLATAVNVTLGYLLMMLIRV